MANVIAILVIVGLVGLACYRIYKAKKNGGCCGCDCGGGDCHCCSCNLEDEPDEEKPIKIN